MKKKRLIFYSLALPIFLLSCKSEKNEEKQVQHETEQAKSEISGRFMIDSNQSIISWVGSKPAGKHNGQIKIKTGEMHFKNGGLESGKFTADMKSIHVLDLKGDEKKDLENHLKGTVVGKENHFFNVDKYPESQFIIKSVNEEENSYKIYGVLTIKGISNPVEFDAQITFGDGKKATKLVSENFTIDRTNWGIEYMSKSIFDDLKDKFINDDIGLQVKIKAQKI